MATSWLWTEGRVIASESFRIDPADRALEHGIGLFETFRTWDGCAVLLDRHLRRLTRSAEALGLELDPRTVPDQAAVESLVAAYAGGGSASAGDVRLRLTASGGPTGAVGRVWMTAGPLPAPAPPDGAALAFGGWLLHADDPLVRHKSLNYWTRRILADRARADGAIDAVLGTADGRLWEGTLTNLFLIQSGRCDTPRADGPLVPGIFREVVLERAAGLGWPTAERDIVVDDFRTADEVFLTNAVRGIIPVSRTPWGSFPAPGPQTRALAEAVASELRRWARFSSKGGRP